MSANARGEFFIYVILLIIVALPVIAWEWYRAGVEQDVWNRCNPNHYITQWEALVSDTRIEGCTTKQEQGDE